jgi:hypothetical protein
MFLAAVMRAGTEQAPVKVRNMSANGALIETQLAPAKGTNVLLLRGPLVAEGAVAWSSSNRCGLRFSSEVSLREWLAAPKAAHQHRVDEIVALVKAGKMSDTTTVAVGQDVVLTTRLQEEAITVLGAVIALLQNLEEDLASSSETMARHGMKLQNLDIAMQLLRAVSAEIALDGTGGAVRLATLKDLKVACAKALET